LIGNKNYFSNYGHLCYNTKTNVIKRRRMYFYETCKNIKHKKITEYSKEGRMWRVPDIMSVSMQDFLYSWKSEVRADKIA